MSITQQEFNRQCIKFVSKCRELDDSWTLFAEDSGQELSTDELESCNSVSSRLMLVKTIIQIVSDAVQTIEYNVKYSESYEVPVMYFCASNQDGSPLGLDDILARTAGRLGHNVEQIINQVEHPILFRPFFMVHPCRTRNFMEPHTRINPSNYLICWLSTVGTLLGLKLDTRLFLTNQLE